MPHSYLATGIRGICCGVLLAACSAATGQGMGPESFGLPGYFGMSTPATTRQMGMGAPVACLDGSQFGNPALAAVRLSPDASLRMVTTDPDRGPKIKSLLANYTHPLNPGIDGLQATFLSLDSSSGTTLLPGIGPVPAALSEDALIVDYGRSVDEKLSVGLCILGFESSEFRLKSAAGPALIAVDADADYGARVGFAYEWIPGDFLGLTFSYAQHTVDATGLMLVGPARSVYHSTQFALGASRHITPQVTAVAEFRRGKTANGNRGSTSNGWHFGAEYAHPSSLCLRAGLADESPTFGLGYEREGWRLDYAFIRDWNDDAVGALFGGSDTHSLQLSYAW